MNISKKAPNWGFLASQKGRSAWLWSAGHSAVAGIGQRGRAGHSRGWNTDNCGVSIRLLTHCSDSEAFLSSWYFQVSYTEMAEWASGRGGSLASCNPSSALRDLSYLFRCTAAAGVWALSLLPALFKGSHFIQVTSFKFFPFFPLQLGIMCNISAWWMAIFWFWDILFINPSVLIYAYLFIYFGKWQTHTWCSEEISPIRLLLVPLCKLLDFFLSNLQNMLANESSRHNFLALMVRSSPGYKMPRVIFVKTVSKEEMFHVGTAHEGI